MQFLSDFILHLNDQKASLIRQNQDRSNALLRLVAERGVKEETRKENMEMEGGPMRLSSAQSKFRFCLRYYSPETKQMRENCTSRKKDKMHGSNFHSIKFTWQQSRV